MADLLTLAEYKALVGVQPTNTRNDTQITALLGAASRAVRQYTDRRFDLASGSSARTYQYDGSGFLEVDDFTNLVEVATDGGYTGGPLVVLDDLEYTAQPYRENADDDPSYYIVLHSLPGSYSPEMGFERNLDTMDISPRPVLIQVTASWGWPAVPDDVKLAAAWVIEDALAKPASDDMRSEAIAGYSRTWGVTESSRSLALPARSRDILNNYVRMF